MCTLIRCYVVKFVKKNSFVSICSCSFFHSWFVVWPEDGPDEGQKHVAIRPECKVLCVDCIFVSYLIH
jgi:NAD-dependent dihydropyrimidine dehydrogenase PreA subunit